jgi:hypothetical protein
VTSGPSEEELTPLQEDRTGDARDIALRKRMVSDLLHPPLSRFVEVLRTSLSVVAWLSCCNTVIIWI